MRSRICQVALSTRDLRRSHTWYRKTLGLLPGGHLRERGGVMLGGSVRPFDVWCLLTGQPFFQFELFEFPDGPQRPEQPCGCGFRSLGFGGAQGGRWVDPDGIPVEAVADGEAPGLRAVTLGVPDVERARRWFAEVLELRPSESEVSLELVPCLAAIHRPDRGIWNVALTCDSLEDYDVLRQRVLQAGYKLDFPPLSLPGHVQVMAFVGDQEVAVELLFVEPPAMEGMGFLPGPLPD
jgi:catechol 2,3-dioxygenase-like lactoylglutathione lyase family enzyme